MFRIATLLLFVGSTVSAGVLEFDLKAGQVRSVMLESPVDDSNFRDPRGYAGHGAVTRHFTRRIEIANTGAEVLAGRLLVVNGRDWTNADSFVKALGLSAEPDRQGGSMKRLFTFWKDHRSHAGSWAKLANEPFAALNFWGYTLCVEDTQSLARLAAAIEVPARHVELNGHIAAEYRYDGAWHVFDGDANACYLRLDNATLASADDLRADPFLVLRTRAFGKFAPLSPAAGAFNSSLIEHVNPADPQPLKFKTGAAPLNIFKLEPGESLAWLCDSPPEKPVGELSTEKPGVLRAAALATIEHRLVAKPYKVAKNGTIAVMSPFPIFKAINHTTGATFAPKAGEVIFKALVEVKSPDDKISVFSQCSQIALPLLSRGDNSVVLDAKKGAARVSVVYAEPKKVVLPDVTVTPRPAAEGSPGFAIVSRPAGDRIWWQVATGRDFAFVAPSLEGVIPFARDFRFEPLSDTFLTPGRSYFIRAKGCAAGVWSRWSEPAEFRVTKPKQPGGMKFEDAGAGRVRLTWSSGAKNAEFLVFASNRIDFMPEIYADEEVVALDHLKVTEKRANRNLLAIVKEESFEFVPAHRFYRVIARRGEALSVPGELVRLPDAMAAKLPPATVLQTRAGKADGKDRYRAKEEPLPVKAPPGE